MKWVLGPAARLVARRPWWAIGIVVAVTIALGLYAAQQSTDTDITAFAPDDDVGRAFTQLETELSGGSGAVQVILDAGAGESVIGPAGVEAVVGMRTALYAEPAVIDVLSPGSARQAPIMSFADPVIAGLEAQGIDPLGATAGQIEEAGRAAYASNDAALAGALTSRDRDLGVPEARAGMLLVRLRAGLTDEEMLQAAVTVRDVVESVGATGVTTEVFSTSLVLEELTAAMDDELPPLLGLAFGLVVLILAVFYRRISDVLLGIVCLMLAIVWMYGIGVLLGPDYLGWVGEFTQISIVVPVLLVGLGIDYAVHLTSRYREELSLGAGPTESARVAVVTVGGALVLATATTLVGFLTNLSSPTPPVGDFGVFAAVGVLAAFVVMLLTVPAVRSLLDRRRSGDGSEPPRDPLRPLTRVMRATAVLATRVPYATLGFAVAVTIVSVVVASGLTTEFSQEEFIPEGSEAERLLGVVDDLFGGDVSEESAVVFTGNVIDPDLANAMLEVEARMADTPHVRLAGDRAQVLSPASVVFLARQQAAEESPAEAAAFTELGLTATGFAPDADLLGLYTLAAEYAPIEMGSVIAQDGSVAAVRVSTSAGEEDVGELAAALEEDAAPLEAAGARVTVTSRNILIDEVSTTLTASQQRSIFITLGAALAMLVLYYAIADRRPLLGAVTMIPSILVVAWTLGTMRLMGLSFNVLTGTVASLAIGIGVPYGIHVTHRFIEDRERTDGVAEAIRATVGHTGAALAGAALTTAAGFGVLRMSSLIPMQQFGAMTAITILYSLAAAVLAQPACLVLWDRFDRWREGRRAARGGVPAQVG